MLFYFVSYVVNRYTANSPEEAVTNSEDKRGRNEGQGYLALCTDPKVVVIFACHFFLSRDSERSLFMHCFGIGIKIACPFAIYQPKKTRIRFVFVNW